VDTLIFRNILPGACNKAKCYLVFVYSRGDERGAFWLLPRCFSCDGLLNIRAQAAALTKQQCACCWRTAGSLSLSLLDETHYIFSSRRGIRTQRSVSRAIFLHPDAGCGLFINANDNEQTRPTRVFFFIQLIRFPPAKGQNQLNVVAPSELLDANIVLSTVNMCSRVVMFLLRAHLPASVALVQMIFPSQCDFIVRCYLARLLNFHAEPSPDDKVINNND
jgi:hypothetical protein